jgi:phosphoglycolate phosphatase-like HAD superfamily hydrolase
MNKKIKIAFDLDGVFVDKPPFIPKAVIEFLFRGHKSRKLHYRFPKNQAEQLIRKISHYYLFRPPIKENIEFLKRIAQKGNFELFIISGRYSFLEKETAVWLEKKGIKSYFKKVFVNLSNDQPHLFKEKILNQVKPDIFIDDDPVLVDYLVKKGLPNIFFFDKEKPATSLEKIIQ